jgi:oxygen-dependent protoporphyrinogen oxidase
MHLRSIPYASSTIVNIAYRRDQVRHPLNGFGAVVPILENRQILAISFTSVKFPRRAPEGTVLMRVFVGGATQPELAELEDGAVLEIVRRELGELLGAHGEPLLQAVARHERAMPQYTLGHLDRVAKIRELADMHPGLILAGNAYGGVGIPDCVRSGQEAAERVLRLLTDPEARAVA